MIGRGLLADPSLARQLRGGAKAGKDELAAWYRTLYEGWAKRYRPVQALGRIKKLMEWPCGGDIRCRRALRRARDIGECMEALFERAEAP